MPDTTEQLPWYKQFLKNWGRRTSPVSDRTTTEQITPVDVRKYYEASDMDFYLGMSEQMRKTAYYKDFPSYGKDTGAIKLNQLSPQDRLGKNTVTFNRAPEETTYDETSLQDWVNQYEVSLKDIENTPWSEMSVEQQGQKIQKIIMEWGPLSFVGGFGSPSALRYALGPAAKGTGATAVAAGVGRKILTPLAKGEYSFNKIASNLVKTVGEKLPQVLTRNAAPKVAKSVVGDIAKVTEEKGGATFNLVTAKNLAGEKLFAVSAFPERAYTSTGAKLTKSELSEFITKNSDLLSRSDVSVGTWFDKDINKVVADIVITTPNKKSALSYATAHNQKAIYDLASGKEISIMRHYGETARTTVSPEFMGTGQSGSESKMLQEYKDVYDKGGFAKRSYWYEAGQKEEPRFAGKAVSFAERPGKVYDAATATPAEQQAFEAKKAELLQGFRSQFGENFGNLGQQGSEVEYATAKALGYEGYAARGGVVTTFGPTEAITPVKFNLTPQAPVIAKPKPMWRTGDVVKAKIGGSYSSFGLANKKDLEAMAFEPNALKSALQFMAKAPGASKALRVLSPQMIEKIPTAADEKIWGEGITALHKVWRAKILHAQASDITNRQGQQLLSKLYRVGNSKDIFGLTPEGIVTKGVKSKPGTESIFIMDVLSKPNNYYWEDPVALQYAKVYNQIGSLQTKSLTKAGVKFPEIELGEGEFYVSRRAAGVVNEDGSQTILEKAKAIPGGMQIGSKPYYFKARDPRSQQEMFKQAGIIYEGPEETMKARLRATGKLLANSLVVDDLKSLGTFAGEKGFRAVMQDGTINLPAFRGYVLKPELAEATSTANKLFAPEKDVVDHLLKIGDDVNAAVRFVQTGFDPGFYAVNYQLAATQPITYARGIAKGMQVFSNPQVINAYRARPDVVALWNKMGQTTLAGLEATDITQAARGAGLITKVPLLNKLGSRFEKTFEFIGYYYRTEMAMALEPTASKRGITGLQQLADHLNHLTAVVNTESMGVPARQRLIEGTTFYAARMKRAAFALFLDAAQGGIRGDLARKALGKWMAGAAAAFTGLAYATGQEERLNPNHPQSIFRPDGGGFLNIKVGNMWVGVGGMARQMLRLGGEIGQAMVTGDDPLEKTKNLSGAFATWYRSSASPLVGIAWDVISGRDFLGNRLDTLGEKAAAEAQQFLPFGVATGLDFILSDVEPKIGAIAGGVEWVGFPTRPVSLYDKLTATQLDLLKNTELTTIDGNPVTKWDDLNEGQIHDLEVKNPELSALEQQISAQYYLNTAAEPSRAWFNAKNSVADKYSQQMLNLVQQLKAGDIDTYEFFKQRSIIKAENRAGKAVAWAMRLDLEGLTDEQKEEQYRENQKPEDTAMDDYQEVWANPVIGKYGVIDWDATKKASDFFLEQLPPEIRDYILKHNNDYLDYLPDEVKAIELEIKQIAAEGSGWSDLGGGGGGYKPRTGTTATSTSYQSPEREPYKPRATAK